MMVGFSSLDLSSVNDKIAKARKQKKEEAESKKVGQGSAKEEKPVPEKKPEPKKAPVKKRVEQGVVELDPNEIEPWQYDDRSPQEIERDLERMIPSVKANGQSTPILVRPKKKGGYEEIYGRVRLETCRALGIKVRAEIKDLDDAAAMALQVTENNDRSDVSAWSKAVSYNKAMNCNIYESITAFAARANLDRTTVSNLVNTAKRMPEKIAEQVDLTFLGQNALLLICGFCEESPAFVDELLANKDKLESKECGPSTIKRIHKKWLSDNTEIKEEPNNRTVQGKHGDYFTITRNNNGALLINFLKKGRELLTEDEIAEILKQAMDER